MHLVLVELALALSVSAPPPPPPAPAAKPAAPEKVEPANTGPAPASRTAFELSLKALRTGNPADAAAGFYAYVSKGGEGAQDAEWAIFFLGQALEQLDLSQGALEMYYWVSKQRSKPEVVPGALAAIERLMRKGPVDEEALLKDLLWGSDFGPQEPPLEDFVQYWQGLFDLRAGHDVWSERHWARVRPDGAYGLKIKYARAVALLRGRGDPEAVAAMLKGIANADAPGWRAREVKNDARLALARLYFEQKKYPEAVEAYRSVELPELDPGRGSIYLEEAWALYRSSDLGLAMGRLAALDSPAFRKLYLPEKYQLRGLIYKDLCRWLPAKRAARDFQRHYAKTLEAVRQRESYIEVEQVMAAAYQEGALSRLAARKDQLTQEEARLVKYSGGFTASGLMKRLTRAYDLARAEADRALSAESERASARVVDSMLFMDEQMRILDYEIGLALYQRARKGESVAVKLDATYEEKDGDVYYAFDKEFWNDELKDMRFSLSSRCAAQGVGR